MKGAAMRAAVAKGYRPDSTIKNKDNASKPPKAGITGDTNLKAKVAKAYAARHGGVAKTVD